MSESSERYQKIYDRRMSGETFRAIAKDLGISAGRVNQIVRIQERRIKFLEKYPKRNGQDITLDLSAHSVFDTRIAISLRMAQLFTLSDIAKMIEDGGLHREADSFYQPYKVKVRNLGKHAWQKILHTLSVAGFEWRKYVK